MPAEIDARAVTRLFPEIAKDPEELLVNMKSHGMTVPDASLTFKTPIMVPESALLFTVELLILIVIELSDRQWSRVMDAYALRGRGVNISLQ
jgi:hypothetical protein